MTEPNDETDAKPDSLLVALWWSEFKPEERPARYRALRASKCTRKDAPGAVAWILYTRLYCIGEALSSMLGFNLNLRSSGTWSRFLNPVDTKRLCKALCCFLPVSICVFLLLRIIYMMFMQGWIIRYVPKETQFEIKHNPRLSIWRSTENHKHQSRCFSLVSHFTGPLKGRWLHTEQSPWWQLGCPFQRSADSCSYMEYPTNERSLALSRLRYWPESCFLERFNPEAFLKLLENRKLVFAGDSLSVYHFDTTLCRLRDFVEESHITWGNASKRSLGRCGPSGKCIIPHGQHSHYIPSKGNPQWVRMKFNVSIHIELIKEHRIEHVLSGIDYLTPHDLVILNKGAFRQNGYEHLKQQVANFTGWYSAVKYKYARIWWRESAPQHFQGNDGDYIMKSLPKTFGTCVPASSTRLSWTAKDRVNAVTESGIRDADIPVMYISRPLVTRHDAHTFNDGTDCTHFCAPSVDVFWADLLYNLLLAAHNSWPSVPESLKLRPW